MSSVLQSPVEIEVQNGLHQVEHEYIIPLASYQQQSGSPETSGSPLASNTQDLEDSKSQEPENSTKKMTKKRIRPGQRISAEKRFEVRHNFILVRYCKKLVYNPAGIL